MNKNLPVCRTVRFIAAEYLRATGRPIAGVGYQRLKDSLDRLRGTSVNTNIKTAGIYDVQGFGLIDSWRIVGESELDSRKIMLEITLPDWLYRSLITSQVLTLSSDYFNIKRAFDRRIYEIARKHCGKQKKWCISLERLREKSGSTMELKAFRREINKLSAANNLPDYKVMYVKRLDIVIFTPK